MDKNVVVAVRPSAGAPVRAFIVQWPTAKAVTVADLPRTLRNALDGRGAKEYAILLGRKDQPLMILPQDTPGTTKLPGDVTDILLIPVAEVFSAVRHATTRSTSTPVQYQPSVNLDLVQHRLAMGEDRRKRPRDCVDPRRLSPPQRADVTAINRVLLSRHVPLPPDLGRLLCPVCGTLPWEPRIRECCGATSCEMCNAVGRACAVCGDEGSTLSLRDTTRIQEIGNAIRQLKALWMDELSAYLCQALKNSASP
jgi:hypothetical protein